jgi:quercetin dioxygenase-like cupin family protein
MHRLNESDLQYYQQVAPGVFLRTLQAGKNTHMVAFRLLAGKKIPSHSHPHEQCGYLVSGRVTMERADRELQNFGPGDSWVIPGDVAHGVEVMEDALVIEVFSPVREDYLALDDQ